MTGESNRNSKDETAEDLSFSSKDLDEYNNGIEGLSKKRYVSKEKRTEMIRKFLLDKFPNIRLEPADTSMKYEPSNQERTSQMLDCRDRYLNDVHAKIEEFQRKKLENMQNLSKNKLEDLTESDGSELKLSSWKVNLLKFEQVLRMRNFMILVAIIYFTYVVIIPEAKYILNVYDMHYFGYYNERLPRLAKTTMEKKYFKQHGIPFYLYEDLKMDRIREAELKAAGLPPAYLDKYGDEAPTQPTLTRLYNSVINGKNTLHQTYVAANETFHDHKSRFRFLQSTKKNNTAPIDPNARQANGYGILKPEEDESQR